MSFSLGSVVATFKADMKGFHKSLKNARRQVGELSQAGASMARFGNTVVSAAKKAGIALGIATVAVGIFSLKAASTFQQNSIAFETMLGSAEAAQAMLKDITNFAKTTPFELPGVVTSAKTLLAMGVEAEKVIPTLEAVGNAVAGTGADMERVIFNYGQVRTQTKLTGVELKDFLRNGIPLLGELAKNLGVSEAAIKDMVSTGQISFSDVEQAFQSMSGEGGRFENLMRKQSKSIGGIWSNIKDSIGIALTDIIGLSTETGEIVEGSLFEKINGAAEKMQNWIEENQDAIIEFSRVMIDKLVTAGTKVVEVIKKIVKWFQENKKVAIAIAIGFAVFVAAALVAAAVAAIAANWIIFAIAAVVAIVSFLAGMVVQNWDLIKEKTMSVFTAIKDFFVNTWNSIKDFFTGFVEWYITTTINTWEAIKNAFKTAIAAVINFFMKLPERIIFGIGWLFGRLMKFVLIDLPVFIAKVIIWFKLLPKRVEHFATLMALKFILWMAKLWISAREKTVNGVNDLAAWFMSLPGRIVTAAKIMRLKFMLKLVEFGKSMFDWAKGAVDGIVNFFVELPGRIVDAVKSGVGAVGDGLRSVGSSLLSGFKSGLGLPGAANGIRNFQGGSIMVGERGPEVVQLPKGSNVVPNHDLGSGGGAAIVNNNYFNTEAAVDAFTRRMKRDAIAAKFDLNT